MNGAAFFFKTAVQALAIGLGVGFASLLGMAIADSFVLRGALCNAMGGSFEGSCGYGQLFLSILLGLVSAVVFFVYKLSASNGQSAHNRGDEPSPYVRVTTSSKPPLGKAWWLSLVLLVLLVWALPFVLHVARISAFDANLSSFFFWMNAALMLFFAVVSSVELKKVNWHPLWSLIALMPYIGIYAVIALVLVARATLPKTVEDTPS